MLPRVISAAALVALVLSGPGPSVTVRGKVTVHLPDGSDSAEAADLVVFIGDVNEPVKGMHAEVRQHNRQFVPRVLAIAAGTEVTFPNEDVVEHNVFSHSSNADFDLGRFAKGPGKTRLFEVPGVAEIYCNVHPEMIAYLVVAPSSSFAVTARDGSFALSKVPAGHHQLVVWDRFSRPRLKQLDFEAKAEAEPLAITIEERAAADAPHKNKFGIGYPVNYH